MNAVAELRAPGVESIPEPVASDLFHTLASRLLLFILAMSVVVAWSPRYWPVALLHTELFALAIGWIGWNTAHPQPAPRQSAYLLVPVTFIGLWGIVQRTLGTTIYGFATDRAILYWAANAVAMFLAWRLLQRSNIRKTFLSGLAWFTGAIAIVSVLQYFTSPYRIYWMFPTAQHVKAVGPFVYRNQFAALVELILPIALYRVMAERRHRWVSAMLAALLFAVVVATASRAGTLLVIAELLVVFITCWSRGILSRRAFAMVFGQVLALTIVFTLIVGVHEVWSRFQYNDPFAMRARLTKSTLRMIHDRPLMGSGLGTWPTVYPEYATFDNSLFANEAHNDWAQWAAEGGLPFGFAMFLVAAAATILAWRTVWGIGVVFVFAHSLIDYPTREPVIGAILFVLIGAMAAARREILEVDD